VNNEIVIYVSPLGNDSFTGSMPETAKDGSDGPLATLEQAQRIVRSFRRSAELRTVRVILREGVYQLDRTLAFSDDDFGSPELFDWHTSTEPLHPVVYEAYPGEQPVISGGRTITGFVETEVHGQRAWVVDVPGVANCSWSFTELWVDGDRRFRPILPKEGEFLIETPYDASFEGTWSDTVGKGTNRFGYAEGDINPEWTNLQDVEIVILSLWRSLRAKLDRVDAGERVAYLDRNSRMRLTYDFGKTGAAYSVENVFEALDTPGEWYLDKAEGKLFYLPMPGELIDTAEVVAPYLCTLLEITGGRLEKVPGQKILNTHPFLIFRGLALSHTEWPEPQSLATIGQSADMIPGAVSLTDAHHVAFEECSFTHVGTYGIAFEEKCWDNRVIRCTIDDMGAGGVKIWHGCGRNTVADCDIGNGGHLFPPAAGVLIGDAPSNIVVHNDIHDLFYTGVSVGWLWGYDENQSGGNVIEWNHIHHLGKGKLSDMGGIYTLGMQAGTRLRYNLIHDVWSRTYGGWAIYPDEGSSHLLIENNICYDTKCAPFHQHFGLENIVQNNIFAFGKEAQIERGRRESHVSFTFERNIIAFSEGVLLRASSRAKPWSPEDVVFQNNCYFDTGGRPIEAEGMSFEEWQKTGQDTHSIVADPMFADLDARDFTLASNSPAISLGFVPFDLSGVGPR
jgi:hypothetical protein